MDKMTEQDLLTLLDEPMQTLQERSFAGGSPRWLTELAHNLAKDSSIATIAHLFGGDGNAFPICMLYFDLSIHFCRAVWSVSSQESQHSPEQYSHLPFNPDTLLSLLLQIWPSNFMQRQVGQFVLRVEHCPLTWAVTKCMLKERWPVLLAVSRPARKPSAFWKSVYSGASIVDDVHLWVVVILGFHSIFVETGNERFWRLLFLNKDQGIAHTSSRWADTTASKRA